MAQQLFNLQLGQLFVISTTRFLNSIDISKERGAGKKWEKQRVQTSIFAEGLLLGGSFEIFLSTFAIRSFANTRNPNTRTLLQSLSLFFRPFV